ncbi:ABC transporter permease [Rhodococcus sp. PAMC28707]|uniref:ABC transporter permease n=1 Tax=unclassified Rhodococcus (in: high G+C Gram-positive bacteria) TaxID=192944 RepID=UPI00109DACBE|nr:MULTISPECIES: ABC transporter permease [unclassified Rhodococcus (in: high G+C Gram-positive bacteria)]QCB51574.1 ABC transporter permease [Rhodococcus sp. PAMC28705]QCB60258.1 ABC transporter permease [Rhodococcus sp. PAMC28707]
MIWVTWRQFRGTILLGVLAPLLLATAIAAVTFLADRLGSNYVLFRCFGLSTTTCLTESSLTLASLATIALPVVLGVFVGVTAFSRDIERRTHVLGLTQAVGRMRWYWTRVLVVFTPIVLAMVVLGYVVLWSRFGTSPFGSSFVDAFYSRLEFPTFGTIGVVPAGYTALGLVIGSTAALLLRNTIGAMVVTMVATVAVIIAFPSLVREHYATPEVDRLTLEMSESGRSVAYEVAPSDVQRASWMVDSYYADVAGRRIDLPYDACSSEDDIWPDPREDETTADYNDRVDAFLTARSEARVACLTELGADHYEHLLFEDRMLWRFQFTETALCLLLSALLAGGSTLAVRRLRP